MIPSWRLASARIRRSSVHHLIVSSVGLALIASLAALAMVRAESLSGSTQDQDQAAAAWMLEDAGRLPLTEALREAGTIQREISQGSWTTLFEEGFESGSWPAEVWNVYDDDGPIGGEYHWANPCAGRSGARSAWSVGGGLNGRMLDCSDHYPNGAYSVMVTGPISLADATDAQLDFAFWVDTECEGYRCNDKADWLRIWVSQDADTWQGVKIAGDHAQGGDTEPGGWKTHTLDLVAYAGAPQFWIAFIFESDASITKAGGASGDDVRLRANQCDPNTYIRSVSPDRSCYAPGSTAGVFVDLGTVGGSQRVRTNVSLWYSPDILLADAEQTFTAPGQRVIPLQIPDGLGIDPIPPGNYDLVVQVFDAASDCLQDTYETTIRIDPACGTVTAPVPVTPSATWEPPPTVEPTPDIIATLCPGESVHETKRIFVPPAPSRADVVFMFDTTASMEAVLSSAKTNAISIMNSLSVLIPDIQFGVVDFRDYPIEPFGHPGDWAYRLRQPVTGSRAAVESAIGATAHDGGNDGPEAYGRALYESYSDASMGWRSGTRRFVIVFGDSIPHDDDLNAGITAPRFGGGAPWCGIDPCVLDPGRDGRPGTADDLDFQTVLEGMRGAEITLLHVASEGSGLDADDLVHYWRQWARRTNVGGDSLPLADAANLPATIQDLITAASRRISRLSLVALPAQYQSWIHSVPPEYRDLTIPPSGATLTFEVDFRVPAGTALGTTHRFQVQAIGDGAVYGGQHITIVVPPECATPSPTRVTPTPSRTPRPTPSPTPFVCPPTRPGVPADCPSPNFVRNPLFEKYSRSWFRWDSAGRELVTSNALEGFFSAQLDSPMGIASEAWLFQIINVPPDLTAASFRVDHVARYNAAVNPPPASGRDTFRASIYDASLSVELVRLWEFDPLLPTDCPIDASSTNLSPAQLSALSGRQVALVFHLHKASAAWQAGVLLDGIHLNLCSAAPPCRVIGDKTAHPRVVQPAGEVTVQLSLTGLDGACLPERRPADVMLIVDRSGSMEGRKLEAAKASAWAFVDRLDPARDQIGMVSYSDLALLNQRLSHWAGPVRAEIARLRAAGETNIADAIALGQAELTGPRHAGGNIPVMILLSDGKPNAGGDPIAAAEAAKISGTRIFTVGLGEDVDPDLLRRIATSPADYFFAPGADQLDAIYQQIAGILSGAPATNITITDRLSPYVTLVPDSFTGLPWPEVSPDGRTLTWRIPRLGLETRRWTYRVRMTEQPGTWPVNEIASATYTNSRGEPGSLIFPIPEVTVVEPAAEGSPDGMCRDHPNDDGSLPSNAGGAAWWDSPDIWVRNRADGGSIHQNPVLGQVNTLYVRIRNIGDAALHDLIVHAYDAPGAASIPWPGAWLPEIGQAQVARIDAGGTAIVAIPWTPSQDGHTCFLVRLEAAEDPIQSDGWVPFDNNLCQRNLQVVEGGSGGTRIGAGNRHLGPDYGSLRIRGRMTAGSSGSLRFPDDGLFDRWRKAGGDLSGGTLDEAARSVDFGPGGLLQEGAEIDVRIERIPFEGEELSDFELSFDGPPGADPPKLSIEQWAEDLPIGGVFVRPPERPTIHMPFVGR